jgi:aspartate-semialdehyde dehydrogenase
MPEWARRIKIVPTDPGAIDARLAFSALPSKKARELEPQLARAGIAVCSNASAFRNERDVPLLLPEVNPEHVGLVTFQRRDRKWTGCIATNPNCASAGLTVSLKALHEAFGVRRVFVASMQAVSGAGYPGVSSMDIQDNVIPWIEAEEDKVEWEPRKMMGRF